MKICKEDLTNLDCIRNCTHAYDECAIKCPCRVGGHCEAGCPCPSFPCEPVCEGPDDYENSQVPRITSNRLI